MQLDTALEQLKQACSAGGQGGAEWARGLAAALRDLDGPGGRVAAQAAAACVSLPNRASAIFVRYRQA